MGLLDRFLKIGQGQTENRAGSLKNAGESAQEALEKGMVLEQQGHIELALQLYDQAIARMPELARAHFNRGNILMDSGRAQDALDAYAKAVVYKPDSAATHYNMGNLHLQLGNARAAIQAFQRAIVLKPDFAEAHRDLGMAFDEVGQSAEANARFRQALALQPDCAEPYFNRALALQDLDQLDSAESEYQRTLRIDPNHVNACNNLGVIFTLTMRHLAAVDYFERALAVDQNNTAILINLGDAMQVLHQTDRAIKVYRSAIETDATSAHAFSRLANAYFESGLFADAVESCNKAVSLKPNDPQTLLTLGNALQGLGALPEAIVCYDKALQIEPDFAEVINNMGAIKKRQKQYELAQTYFHRALELNPNFAEAHCNLGNVYQELGQVNAASASYLRALDIKSDFAEAHSGYGSVLQNSGDLSGAENYYRKAIEYRPDLAEAHNNLGTVLSLGKRFDETISSYRRAIAINPRFAAAHANLSIVLKDIGQFEDARTCVLRSLELDETSTTAHDILLFTHNYLLDQSPEQMLADARRYGELVMRMARPFPPEPRSPNRDRPLRIGFVSGDLCNHPVGFFIEGVLAELRAQASDRMALIAYPTRVVDDEASKRIQPLFNEWHPVAGMADAAVAQCIHEDDIDILIDLSGHTGHNRLPVFAWKPAPVQVSWLGYFATTGVAAIDYFIADPWTLPASEEQYFTEQIWRLPETRLCFTPPDIAVDVSPLPALRNGYVTFGCFNNLSKMNDAVVALWAKILNSLPESRLFLKAGQIAIPEARNGVLARFAKHGVSGERLILEEFSSRANYLSAYHHVDLALDPFPFPGGTTSVEALWMGVPVLTLDGQRFLCRQGIGLLNNVGLPDWVAADLDDYAARAVHYASDVRALAALRQELRTRVLASPIFDAKRFAKHFECALRDMWKISCERTKDGTP